VWWLSEQDAIATVVHEKHSLVCSSLFHLVGSGKGDLVILSNAHFLVKWPRMVQRN